MDRLLLHVAARKGGAVLVAHSWPMLVVAADPQIRRAGAVGTDAVPADVAPLLLRRTVPEPASRAVVELVEVQQGLVDVHVLQVLRVHADPGALARLAEVHGPDLLFLGVPQELDAVLLAPCPPTLGDVAPEALDPHLVREGPAAAVHGIARARRLLEFQEHPDPRGAVESPERVPEELVGGHVSGLQVVPKRPRVPLEEDAAHAALGVEELPLGGGRGHDLQGVLADPVPDLPCPLHHFGAHAAAILVDGATEELRGEPLVELGVLVVTGAPQRLLKPRDGGAVDGLVLAPRILGADPGHGRARDVEEVHGVPGHKLLDGALPLRLCVGLGLHRVRLEGELRADLARQAPRRHGQLRAQFALAGRREPLLPLPRRDQELLPEVDGPLLRGRRRLVVDPPFVLEELYARLPMRVHEVLARAHERGQGRTLDVPVAAAGQPDHRDDGPDGQQRRQEEQAVVDLRQGDPPGPDRVDPETGDREAERREDLVDLPLMDVQTERGHLLVPPHPIPDEGAEGDLDKKEAQYGLPANPSQHSVGQRRDDAHRRAQVGAGLRVAHHCCEKAQPAV
mmetsp:Transcript_49826/g.153880  ORF Transcript_49826/g.153880 Transcript_49826/m.153880 type:complete len:568 (+) Transcript_49826:422-2125(+)